MRRPDVWTLFALASFGGAAVTGCGQKKVDECNKLINVINEGVRSLEASAKFTGDANGIAELRNMADAMDKVAADTQKVEITVPELRKYATDYQAMARDVSKAAREMAQAAEAKDEKKMSVAQASMEQAVKAEDPLVESLNKFCQSP